MGPGPGVHGGTVVIQGDINLFQASGDSITGQFLSGKELHRSVFEEGATLRVECESEKRSPNSGDLFSSLSLDNPTKISLSLKITEPDRILQLVEGIV